MNTVVNSKQVPRQLATNSELMCSTHMYPSSSTSEHDRLGIYNIQPQANKGTGSGPEHVDLGQTLQILTQRLPLLLKESSLPPSILSETISLEVLPSTLGLPEIKSKTAYLAISRVATWSVCAILPEAELVVDSQKLIGTKKQCERLVVRFRIVGREGKTAYTGLFHFYFDSNGKISRHIFEVRVLMDRHGRVKCCALTSVQVVDDRWNPRQILNWVVGRRVPVVSHNLSYGSERK